MRGLQMGRGCRFGDGQKVLENICVRSCRWLKRNLKLINRSGYFSVASTGLEHFCILEIT